MEKPGERLGVRLRSSLEAALHRVLRPSDLVANIVGYLFLKGYTSKFPGSPLSFTEPRGTVQEGAWVEVEGSSLGRCSSWT
jgi:hypothetical protein